MLIKKIPDVSGLVTRTAALKTKISEVENKTPDTNLEFNKLTAKTFAARLKQVGLVNKTDFDQITSNKTKSNNKKLYFFLGRIYFKSNNGYQNTFAYQPTLDTLELKKKTKVLIIFLGGNQREYLVLNISHYILLS